MLPRNYALSVCVLGVTAAAAAALPQYGVLTFDDISIPGVGGHCEQFMLTEGNSSVPYHGFILQSSASLPDTAIKNTTIQEFCQAAPSGIGPWHAAFSKPNTLAPFDNELRITTLPHRPFGILGFYYTAPQDWQFDRDPDAQMVLTSIGTKEDGSLVQHNTTGLLSQNIEQWPVRLDPAVFSHLAAFTVLPYFLSEGNLGGNPISYYDSISYVFH